MKEKSMHKYVERAFDEYCYGHEIKFYRKRIDFTFIDDHKKIHAIELKIKDWQNALNQIETNQLFADYSYLGIWHKNEENVPKKILKKYGFGLISISKNQCKTIVAPRESSIINEKYQLLIKKQLKGE